jgi:phage-related minor tail protein
MVEIANIGFAADTTGLQGAARDLDQMANAADRAGDAAERMATDVAAAGQKVGAGIGAATAQANRQLNEAAVKFRTLQEQIDRGLRIGGSSGDGAASARAIEELTNLREKYVPLAKAQREYQDSLDEIARAQSAGALTSAQAAKAVEGAGAAYQRQTVLLGQTGGAAKLTAMQMQQLGFQVNDLATQLASGANPLQAFAQQGGQIYQALSMGPGGAGGALRALGSLITSVVTPGRLAFAGLATGVLGFGLALNSALGDQRELERALGTGLGRAAGLTVDQFKAISNAASDAAGVSRSAGQAMALEFAKTGKIGGEMFADLILFSRRYAETTGQDFADAGKEIAKFFADPAKGVEQLQDRLGALDGSERALIRSLIEANDKMGAQQAMVAAFGRNSAVAAAQKEIRTLGDVWDALARKAANAANATVNAVRKMVAPDKGEVLKRAEAELAEMESFQPSRLTRAGARKADEWDAQIAAQKRYIEGLKEAIRLDEIQAKQQQDRNAARSADNLAAQYTPAIDAIGKLIQARNELGDALAKGLPVEDAARVADAYRRVTDELRTYGTARSQLAIDSARTVEGMRAEAEAVDRLNAMLANGTISYAQAQAQMANAQQLAKLASEAQQAAQRGEIDLAKELWNAYDQLVGAIDRSTQAKARSQAASTIQGLNDEIALLRIKISMHGEEKAAIDAVIAAKQVEQQIRNMGLSADDPQAKMLRDRSAEAQRLRQQLEELNDTTRNGSGAVDQYGEAWKRAGAAIEQAGYIISSTNWQSGIDALLSAGQGGGGMKGTFGYFSSDWLTMLATKANAAMGGSGQDAGRAQESALEKSIRSLEQRIDRLRDKDTANPDPYAEKNPLVFFDPNSGRHFSEYEKAALKALEEEKALLEKQLEELKKANARREAVQQSGLPQTIDRMAGLNFLQKSPGLFSQFYELGLGGYTLKGFAEGGSMTLGGKPGRDSNVLQLNGRPIARVSRGEQLDFTPRGGQQQAAAAPAAPAMNDNRTYHIHVKRDPLPPGAKPEDERMADERMARRVNDAIRRSSR